MIMWIYGDMIWRSAEDYCTGCDFCWSHVDENGNATNGYFYFGY